MLIIICVKFCAKGFFNFGFQVRGIYAAPPLGNRWTIDGYEQQKPLKQ